MTDKWKISLSLLLIALLVGCGIKTDDGLHIENHDWTSTQAIDSAGQPLDLPALTCAAQNGALTITDADGNEQSGTYSLRSAIQTAFFMISRSMVRAAAVVSTTEYVDADGKRKANIRSSLSLPERTVYFRADLND